MARADRRSCARRTAIKLDGAARGHRSAALPPRQLQRQRSTSCILDALMAEKNAEIAFSPGFRWGTTLLPGEAITLRAACMDQTAITYPYVDASTS